MTPTKLPWAAHLPRHHDGDVLAQGTLPAAWGRNWRQQPAKQVIRDVDGTWHTGAMLDAATATMAGRLVGAGLVAGDRVIVSGASSAALVVAHCAALRAGLVVVPMNTAYQPREIAHIVQDSRPRAAIVDRAEVAAAIREADGTIVVVGTDIDLADGPVPQLDASDPGDDALIGYTSGTTGAPKGAVLTHANLLASAAAVQIAWRWTPNDRLVLCLPLFHAHGMGVGLHGTLLSGASAVLQDGFQPEAVFDAIADDSLCVTMFFGVPTMYTRLVDHLRVGELGRLRLCVSGSAPLSAELHVRMYERCGQHVLERYGMTETMMLVSNPYDSERRAGTVGIPLPGVHIRLAPGSGEIEVRGPNVFSGYLDRPDATAEAFTADGWFRTGDVGELDSAGYLRIVGRTKELIITGGYNVYPREIEDVLREHPQVRDVAVVGTPSAEWGETVTAFVVAENRAEFDTEAMLAFAATELARFKRPRIVHLLDELPRNAMGKVVRHALKPDHD